MDNPRSQIVSSDPQTQQVIEGLSDKWRVRFEVEECLDELAELRSRQRIHQYLNTEWITEEMAERLLALLDEAG